MFLSHFIPIDFCCAVLVDREISVKEGNLVRRGRKDQQ